MLKQSITIAIIFKIFTFSTNIFNISSYPGIPAMILELEVGVPSGEEHKRK